MKNQRCQLPCPLPVLTMLIASVATPILHAQSEKKPPEAVITKPASWADSVYSDRSVDFGRQAVGTVTNHCFRLFNHGQTPVKINSFASSCGCMKANVKFRTIPANKFVDLVVTPQTSRFHGKKSASIHVRFDRPANEIKFVASINISSFKMSHDKLSFVDETERRSASKAAPVRKVKIERIDGKDWEIEGIRSSSPHLQARIDADCQANDSSKTLICTIDGSKLSRKAAVEHLILRTSDSWEPEISIPVEIGRAVEPIRSGVDKLYFTIAEIKQGTEKRLLLQTRDKTEVTLTGLDERYFNIKKPARTDRRAHVVRISAKLPAAIDLTAPRKANPKASEATVGTIIAKTRSGEKCEIAVVVNFTNAG